MSRKITQIEDLKKLLPNCLICLRQEIRQGFLDLDQYTYVTKNKDFAASYNAEISGDNLFDFIQNDKITFPVFQGFYGEVFKIATIGSPKYHTYIRIFEEENIPVNYELPIFLITSEGFKNVSFQKEENGSYIVFTDYGDSLSLNEYGRNEKGEWLITNFNENNVQELFSEREGYLLLGQNNEPKLISNNVYSYLSDNKVREKILKELGFFKNEYIKVLPVLNIYCHEAFLDTILLNSNSNITFGVKKERNSLEGYELYSEDTIDGKSENPHEIEISNDILSENIFEDDFIIDIDDSELEEIEDIEIAVDDFNQPIEIEIEISDEEIEHFDLDEEIEIEVEEEITFNLEDEIELEIEDEEEED
ncbi:MAG: hypothetical protein CL760_00265 [Chloroflexi bacterium]|nr:hypothetical protein [Chloroflexota bacterium]|tara:strand:- start:52601 stop:53689 length:1089 start_codon:yes stop_codon:yes gene_type:complete